MLSPEMRLQKKPPARVAIPVRSRPEPQEESSTFLDHLAVLWTRRNYVLGFLAAGCVLSLIFTLSQKFAYRAELQLEVQELNQNFMNVGQVDPTAIPQQATPDNYVQTQVQVLRSDDLLERVIARLNLENDPAYLAQSVTPLQKIAEKAGLNKLVDALPNSRHAQILRDAMGLPSAGGNSPHSRALRVARASLRVKTAPQSTLVQLSCISPDRYAAAKFLNTLADEFVKQTMETRWAGTERTATWLQARLGYLRANLEASERKLQEYARTSGLLYTNDRVSVGEERLRQIQANLSKAQIETDRALASYEISETSAPEDLPESRDDLFLKDHYTHLADLERQRSQLAAAMKPEHYKVQRVDAEIAQVRQVITRQYGTITKRIRDEYEAAKRREALLADAYQKQFLTVSQQAEQSVPIDVLRHEVESNRQFYQDMLQKVNSARVATALRASNIRVVNGARPPERAYRPDLLINEGIGMGASLALGVFASFLAQGLALRNRKVDRPGDATLSLGLPELGAIPQIKSSARLFGAPPKKLVPWTFSFGARQPVSLAAELAAEGTKAAIVPAWRDQPPALSDSFHGTLDALLFNAGRPQSGQVFVVTSALPYEGKTTVVSHLAMALAEIDKRVLLIDADLRRSQLHARFGVPNVHGLSTELETEGPITNVPVQHIGNRGKGGLWLMTAGKSQMNPAALLSRSKLESLLRIQRRKFDVILIDSPPALLFPDAKLLGRAANGVVLVVHANRNRASVYRETADSMNGAGVTILGTVLNKWRPPSIQRQYYGSYAPR